MRINPENIKINDYSYLLPEERIAKYPLAERDQSKLLVYKQGLIEQQQFCSIDNYIPANSTLVFNNTKVIQARLKFFKETGAQIEIFCLEPVNPSDYALAFQQTQRVSWKCIVGNLKKWKTGQLYQKLNINGENISLSAEKLESAHDAHIIEFCWDNPNISFSDILDSTGSIPIPPYLNRKAESLDTDRYQTVYSKLKGSVAAPTAGLHFTDKVLKRINNQGVSLEEITLHVGAGTFKPVKSDTIDAHEMHTEHFVVRLKSLENLKKSTHITAVGTTSVRTIESIYWLGAKLIQNQQFSDHISQWEAYELNANIEKNEALDALIDYLKSNDLSELKASTQIMIYPGYEFKLVQALVTNFHQPKSTLLLLIAAFIGENWHKVYKFAMENNFRFLSYGDSSILIPYSTRLFFLVDNY